MLLPAQGRGSTGSLAMQRAHLVRTLLLPVACLMSAPAAAVNSYIDLSVGQSTVQHWDVQDINDGSFSNAQDEDSGRSLRIAIGYGLSESFTLEFGHLSLGQ